VCLCPRNLKYTSWWLCISKKSLSTVRGCLAERRPNRLVEAEQKKCKKYKSLNSLAEKNVMRVIIATGLWTPGPCALQHKRYQNQVTRPLKTQIGQDQALIPLFTKLQTKFCKYLCFEFMSSSFMKLEPVMSTVKLSMNWVLGLGKSFKY